MLKKGSPTKGNAGPEQSHCCAEVPIVDNEGGHETDSEAAPMQLLEENCGDEYLQDDKFGTIDQKIHMQRVERKHSQQFQNVALAKGDHPGVRAQRGLAAEVSTALK